MGIFSRNDKDRKKKREKNYNLKKGEKLERGKIERRVKKEGEKKRRNYDNKKIHMYNSILEPCSKLCFSFFFFGECRSIVTIT